MFTYRPALQVISSLLFQRKPHSKRDSLFDFDNMSLKPLVLYSNGPSPNPVKVAIVLEELGLEYEARTTPYETIKAEPFISLNPNGRLPALEDPNTGITLFEVLRSSANVFLTWLTLSTVWRNS